MVFSKEAGQLDLGSVSLQLISQIARQWDIFFISFRRDAREGRIQVTIRENSKYHESIGVRRTWIHPLRKHVEFGSAYFDIVVLELGKGACRKDIRFLGRWVGFQKSDITMLK